jgi:hypothetical protein
MRVKRHKMTHDVSFPGLTTRSLLQGLFGSAVAESLSHPHWLLRLHGVERG